MPRLIMLKNNKHVIGLMNDSTNYTGVYHNGRFCTFDLTDDTYPYIRYDASTQKYYNVTGIKNSGTQYVQTELEPYYLVKMYGLYDFPLGVYASINTVVELWCTKLQDYGDCTISNAWSMNDSTGSWRVFAYNNQNALCFDFGSKSSSWSSSSSKGPEKYMQRLYYYSREPLDGTGDIFHMIVGRIDNKAAQIIYKGDSQVCNNSGTLTSFYRGTDAEAQLHLYHMNNNDDFTFYKVVIWQDGELVRNMYWKKDTNDNLYLYDSVTDSAMTSTVSSGSLTYQTGKDTYSLHGDFGPAKDGCYIANGTITENGVTYEKLVNSIDNTKIIRGIILS